MKKVILLMVGILVVFSFFNEAMAGGVLVGKYASNGTTVCLQSPYGFKSFDSGNLLHPVDSSGNITGPGNAAAWTSITSSKGVWTFKPNGTGSLQSEGIFTILQGSTTYSPYVESNETEFQFTYTLSNGVLAITVIPATYVTSFPGTGPPPTSYSIDQRIYEGNVSLDYLNIVLKYPGPTPILEKRIYANPAHTNYASCHGESVLVYIGP